MYEDVTIAEFLLILHTVANHTGLPSDILQNGQADNITLDLQNICLIGLNEGWLEEQDQLHLYEPLERRNCARIIHQYLRLVCHEADEDDWNAARKLLDLFDCRTCVGHVAQVYVKGIMDAASDSVFGMQEHISREEALTILLSTVDTRLRRKTEVSSSVSENTAKQRIQYPIRITYEEAMAQLQSDCSCALIDVRIQDEYEESHLTGAINLPLRTLLDTPGLSLINKEQPLLLYCNFGIQSDFAARYLLDAGFSDVHSFRIK